MDPLEWILKFAVSLIPIIIAYVIIGYLFPHITGLQAFTVWLLVQVSLGLSNVIDEATGLKQ